MILNSLELLTENPATLVVGGSVTHFRIYQMKLDVYLFLILEVMKTANQPEQFLYMIFMIFVLIVDTEIHL